LVHRLLEHLPQSPPAQREALAKAIVVGNIEVVPDAFALIADVLAIIDASHLGHVFEVSTLAEVELTATIPAFPNHRFHGAIDRLLITDTQITAIDFKTNRHVPNTPEQVPEGILRQMGAYHAMLTEIYPNRQINIAILWTATAHLMPLSHDMLMDALSHATIP
jgi:ATP-dependent helicase/nuclease subunit A